MPVRSLARRAAACATLLAFVNAATAASPVSAADEARILAEVKLVTRAMEKAREHRDGWAATKDLAEGPDLIGLIADGAYAKPEDYRQGLRDFYNSLSKLHFETTRENFQVLGPEAVMFLWTYRVEGTSKKGEAWVIDPQTTTFVLRKINGAWKFVYSEDSIPLPRPGSPNAG